MKRLWWAAAGLGLCLCGALVVAWLARDQDWPDVRLV